MSIMTDKMSESSVKGKEDIGEGSPKWGERFRCKK
jgi:hypothetical protein